MYIVSGLHGAWYHSCRPYISYQWRRQDFVTGGVSNKGEGK